MSTARKGWNPETVGTWNGDEYTTPKGSKGGLVAKNEKGQWVGYYTKKGTVKADFLSAFRGSAEAWVESKNGAKLDTKEAREKRVARKFSELLCKDLGWRAMNEVRKRNDAYGDDCCASHDFCDANMVMQAAFHELGLKTNIECPQWAAWANAQANGGDVEAPAEIREASELWDKAWTIAKAARFDAKKII